MSDTYMELNEWLGNIEECVNRLLEFKRTGTKVKYEFNGHWLYSDTVTMDSAYLELTGKTKAEFDEEQRKWREDMKRRDEEHKAAIPQLTKEWIERGHKIISEDKWADWDECVPIRLADLYKGMELGQCLDLVEILKTGDFSKAKETMENQGHPGMSWGLMKAMIRTFSDVGEQFVAMLD